MITTVDTDIFVRNTAAQPRVPLSGAGGKPALGAQFRHARRSFGLSLEEIAQDIKIRVAILRAIEQGSFDQIDEPIYRTLMVKTYADYLGLDWSILEADYIRESVYIPREEKMANANTPSVQAGDLLVAPRLLKHALLSAAMIGVFLYLMILAGTALSQPSLALSYPPEQYMSASKTLRVEGVVSPDASLSINGQEVTKAHDGHFFQDLTLSEGLNTIHVSASKQYSKETVVTRTVLYQAPSLPLTFNEYEYGKTTTR